MHDNIASELLREIKNLVQDTRELLHNTRNILHHLRNNVIGGVIHLPQGEHKDMLTPGSKATFTVAVQPTGATVVPGASKWTTDNASVTIESVSADGLTAIVDIGTDVAPDTTFTVTWNYTNADGTAATPASIQETVVAPVIDVTGGTITETA